MEVKQKLKIKGKDVPVFIEGEEAGVIAVQTIEIDEDNDQVIEAIAIDNAKEKLIKDNIEVVTEKRK